MTKHSANKGAASPTALLIHYSAHEESLIRKAMAEAARYMRTYGRGETVQSIDKSHYIQDRP